MLASAPARPREASPGEAWGRRETPDKPLRTQGCPGQAEASAISTSVDSCHITGCHLPLANVQLLSYSRIKFSTSRGEKNGDSVYATYSYLRFAKLSSEYVNTLRMEM